MQQNNGNNQNGQDIIPDINNIPGNSYTQYYHEYIVDPGTVKNEVPRPKRVASIVLCAVSTVMLVFYLVMCIAFICSSITSLSPDMTVGSSLGAAAFLFVEFLPAAVVTAIVAKVLNRGNRWALINLICTGVLTVVMLVISIFLPSIGSSANRSGRSYDGSISQDWNRDVEELLEDYSFDVADIDDDYSHLSGDPFEIRIYVSSEATQDQIDEINEFLLDLQKLDRDSRYRIVIKVYPCYFEPGNNSSFVYTKRFRFNYDTDSGDFDIEESLFDDLENARRVPGHVPEELEDGNLLIVVR
ncbi:MAG: hypothetical protein IKG01_09495 [Lachnospiraceae bacterium]|nr:hypothetical protein [Lachnospiraceae bacterium]